MTHGGGIDYLCCQVGGSRLALPSFPWPHDDFARLEDGGGVAKDEVHSAGDGAVFVELTQRMRVQGILVTQDGARMEGGMVARHSKCHRLVLLWAGCVLEGDSLGNESISIHGCSPAGAE